MNGLFCRRISPLWTRIKPSQARHAPHGKTSARTSFGWLSTLLFKASQCRPRTLFSIIALVPMSATLLSANEFSRNSDILGLRLGMSAGEAQSYIEKRFHHQSFPEKRATVAIGSNSREITLGFEADLTDLHGGRSSCTIETVSDCGIQRNNDEQDTLSLLTDSRPGLSRILALIRNTSFPLSQEPTESTLLNALIDKYGQPRATDGLETYYWASGLEESPDPHWTDCKWIGNSVAELDTRFSEVTRNFITYGPQYAPCGTFLRIHFTTVVNPQNSRGSLVISYSTTLVDVESSFGMIKDLSDAVQSHDSLQETSIAAKPQL